MFSRVPLFCGSIVVLVAACLCGSVAFAGHISIPSEYLLAAPSGWEPTQKVRFGFTPNDPYYSYNSPAGYKGQWHLRNQTPGGGPSANVVGAWNRNITGNGVTIGICDDSLETAHPDLAPNYVAADSWDFGQNDSNPNPVNAEDGHGVCVAGVAAARGGNGIGVTGAAPYAKLAGLRIDFNNSQPDQMIANATLYHSSGSNTNIKVKNHSYGSPVPFMGSSVLANALTTSANAGTMHCFAAGNEREYHGYVIDANGNQQFDPDVDYAVDGDANKQECQNSSKAICVAALGADGKFAQYSDWGANVFVTAPSNGVSGYDITTTDRTGNNGYNTSSSTTPPELPNRDYTSQFGGTSSASPLVAGIMALGKQVKSTMDVRMAKQLLARTSVKVDPTDADERGGWVTNHAGYHFNENYGFGLIDADAFTALAAQTASVTPQTTAETGTRTVGASVPDGNTTGISRTFILGTPGKLEDVMVHLSISHSWRGDLEASITSPCGTTSKVLCSDGADSFNDVNWTFCSNAFWGENPLGTWTLKVWDTQSDFTGTWNSFWVTANMGDLVLAPEPGAIVLLTAAVLPALALRVAKRVRRQLLG